MSKRTAHRAALPAPVALARPTQGRMTSVRSIQKADTAALVTNGADSFPEDQFVGTYMAGGNNGTLSILEPYYKPGDLMAVCQQNNTLLQCIEAMEINIDATGHTIELRDPKASADEGQKQTLTDFFDEPFPGKTMSSLRRWLRRDLEQTGNGYLEVIRNIAGEVVMLNTVEVADFRIIRLDEPVVVTKQIKRGGKLVDMQIRARERRYVQLINGKRVFFKEFGSSREVNRDTGEWLKPTELADKTKYGSEILHFKVGKEPRTPYGVPRWINQMPSALGSRKAEEFNLTFFDAGGLPPVLVIVQGGYLGETVKQDLERHLRGGAGTGHRAAIVEAISSSGSLDSSGTVQVRVERFGSERQSDSMFMKYDEACEQHIRCGFRLPPMFLGKAADYNFATAQTGYMVAEAQVFYPEREEFDKKMNNTICKALGVDKYVYKSLPITLINADLQLKGVTLIQLAKATDNEEIVSTVNEITGMSIEYKEPPAPAVPATMPNIDPMTNLPYSNPVDPLAAAAASGKPVVPIPHPNAVQPIAPTGRPKLTVVKQDEFVANPSEIVTLATLWSFALGLTQGVKKMDDEEKRQLARKVATLKGGELHLFNQCLVQNNLAMSDADTAGLMELVGCSTALVV